MGVAPSTVKNFIQSTIAAYGVGSRTMAVMAALTRGDLEMATYRPIYQKMIDEGTLINKTRPD